MASARALSIFTLRRASYNRSPLTQLSTSVAHNIRPRLAATAALRSFSSSETSGGGKVIPINIFKEGQDPVELPDDQYPEWLWELTKPDETLSELEKRKDTLTWENGGKRYFKLLNRKRIKEANARKKGY